MTENNIIRMSDTKPMSDEEIKEMNAKERKAYLKTLRDLCPSKEKRQEAKRLSKRKDSCDMCVYCDGESGICWYPHSDIYMEALNIDHCYEGVLRFLVKKDEHMDEDTAVIDEETDALIDAPLCLKEEILNCNKIIHMLSGYMLEMACEGKKPPKVILKAVRSLHETMEKSLPFYEMLCDYDKMP